MRIAHCVNGTTFTHCYVEVPIRVICSKLHLKLDKKTFAMKKRLRIAEEKAAYMSLNVQS